MASNISKNKTRIRKHKRIRSKISGTPQRPRLFVFRSLSQIYAQIIDDTTTNTLVAASSLDKEIKEKSSVGGNIDAAKMVGALIGERALEKGITEVVFDRGGYIYHGRVKALAEAAREAGLKF